MTSPVSAIEAIEAIEKYIAMRLAAHASECDDPTWPGPHDVQVMRDAKSAVLALARQAEALQRENAEKDARMAELEAGIANIEDAANSFRDEDGYEVSSQIRLRARALLGGSENAE